MFARHASSASAPCLWFRPACSAVIMRRTPISAPTAISGHVSFTGSACINHLLDQAIGIDGDALLRPPAERGEPAPAVHVGADAVDHELLALPRIDCNHAPPARETRVHVDAVRHYALGLQCRPPPSSTSFLSN